MNNTLIWLLGYLTEDQWKDAYDSNELSKASLNMYRKAVEKQYGITFDVK